MVFDGRTNRMTLGTLQNNVAEVANGIINAADGENIIGLYYGPDNIERITRFFRSTYKTTADVVRLEDSEKAYLEQRFPFGNVVKVFVTPVTSVFSMSIAYDNGLALSAFLEEDTNVPYLHEISQKFPVPRIPLSSEYYFYIDSKRTDATFFPEGGYWPRTEDGDLDRDAAEPYKRKEKEILRLVCPKSDDIVRRCAPIVPDFELYALVEHKNKLNRGRASFSKKSIKHRNSAALTKEAEALGVLSVVDRLNQISAAIQEGYRGVDMAALMQYSLA